MALAGGTSLVKQPNQHVHVGMGCICCIALYSVNHNMFNEIKF